MKNLITPIVLALMLTACGPIAPDADEKQAKRMAQQLAQAEQAVAPPRVSNFTQLRDATTIIEIVDQNITTWAYYMDMTGGLHLLCEAKGYGLPFSAQTTNPERKEYGSQGGSIALPQAEPSGLFMPDNVAATWILCARDDGEGFDVVYWEPDLVVTPFPLKAAGNLR